VRRLSVKEASDPVFRKELGDVEDEDDGILIASLHAG
jgi:hypothetical protein